MASGTSFELEPHLPRKERREKVFIDKIGWENWPKEDKEHFLSLLKFVNLEKYEIYKKY